MAPAFLEAEPQTHVLVPFEQQRGFTFSVMVNQHLQDTYYVPGTVQGNGKAKVTNVVLELKWFKDQRGKQTRTQM